MAAFEKPILHHSRPTGADLSAKQYYAVALNTSKQLVLPTTQGQRCVGILQDAPAASGDTGTAMLIGISKAKFGGTVAANDPVTCASDGRLVKADEQGEVALGIALESAVANDIKPVFLFGSSGGAELARQIVLAAAADYSSAGQYTAVKVNSSGAAVRCSTAGERAIGILQNAPASAADAQIICEGVATFKAGTGGVSAGDGLACEADGELVTSATGQYIIGYALADVSAGSTGLMYVQPNVLQAVAGVALASANFWLGNGSGVAAAVTMSGDATMANTGAITVGQTLDGGNMANFTDEQVLGGGLVIHSVLVDSATAGDFDVTVTNKCRVIDAWAQHTGGAGEASDTIQVKNGATAITNAMDWSGADNVIVRAGTIDDAQATIAAAGTLRVTTTDNDAGTDVGLGTVYVLAVNVA